MSTQWNSIILEHCLVCKDCHLQNKMVCTRRLEKDVKCSRFCFEQTKFIIDYLNIQYSIILIVTNTLAFSSRPMGTCFIYGMAGCPHKFNVTPSFPNFVAYNFFWKSNSVEFDYVNRKIYRHLYNIKWLLLEPIFFKENAKDHRFSPWLQWSKVRLDYGQEQVPAGFGSWCQPPGMCAELHETMMYPDLGGCKPTRIFSMKWNINVLCVF